MHCIALQWYTPDQRLWIFCFPGWVNDGIHKVINCNHLGRRLRNEKHYNGTAKIYNQTIYGYYSTLIYLVTSF